MSVSVISRRIRSILREVADSVVELDYPVNFRERSIDLVVSFREKAKERAHYKHEQVSRNIVIRISPTRITTVSDEVEKDLATFAEAIEGVPVVINNELYDNIVFEHGAVFMGNERTLENLVRRRELIAIYRRNELYVALNIDLIEKELARGGLRLSELSDILGLSRKGLESCIKGLGLISITKAEKLVAELSTDMILPVGYEVLRAIFSKKQSHRYSHYVESEPGALIYTLRRTAVDMVVRELPTETLRSLKFYVDLAKTQSIRSTKIKLLNAARLAKEYGAMVEVVAHDPTTLELIRKEIESELGDELKYYIRFSLKS